MNRRDFLRALGIVSALPLVGPSLRASREPTLLDLLDAGQLGAPPLHPVQRFIVKMMYGLELGPREQDYLQLLKDEGRYSPAREGSRETLLIMGRRSGMTHLSQVVQMYELTKLLNDPAGAKPGSVLTVSCDKEMAHGLFDQFTSFVVDSSIRERIRSNTLTSVTFEGLEGAASLLPQVAISARYRSANDKRLRGIWASSVVLDNAAFFEDPQQTFSTVAGPGSARLTTLTSSSGSEAFRTYYAAARKRGALILRVPTWEANPTISHDFFERFKDSTDFSREWGAAV